MATDSPSSPKYKRGEHPNSRKNLSPPFRPGENGNPHPGYPLALRVQHLLSQPLKKPPPDACAGDLLAYSSVEGALLREKTPFKEVWNRVEGIQDSGVKLSGEIIIKVVEE